MRISKPVFIISTFVTTGLLTFSKFLITTNSMESQSSSVDTSINEVHSNHQRPITYEDYNQLKLFFHQTFGEAITFSNKEDEVVYHLTHIDSQELSGITRLSYKGNVIHPTLTSTSHPFEIHYQITGESIIESFKQEKPLFSTHSIHMLFSIIPNKIILKSPLTLGNEWKEHFVYNGNEHQAISTISNLWLDESDRRCYEIQTSVPTLESFKNQPYFETRVYTEGLGLTFFKNNIIEYQLENF